MAQASLSTGSRRPRPASRSFLDLTSSHLLAPTGESRNGLLGAECANPDLTGLHDLLAGSYKFNFRKLLHLKLSLWKAVDPGGFLLHRNR